MREHERIKLLVNIARLYYEHNCSQQEIAKKLGLSRPYISKLINEAKQSGIVQIQISDPYESESVVELEIRRRFNLKKAIVVPTNEDDRNKLEKLASATARYLNSIIKNNDIIGVGWGLTLYTCSQFVIPRNDVNNIVVVQLCGGISNIERNIYATEIPKKIADAYRGTPYILPLPAIIDDAKTKNAIIKDKNIKNVLNIAKKANIAMFTMGAFGHEGALIKAGYINKKEVDDLILKGAVGDICTHFINIDGKICDYNLDKKTIAIELHDLIKKEYRIGVAAGSDKLKCIYASLKSSYPNVLVTDEDTALGILNMCNS